MATDIQQIAKFLMDVDMFPVFFTAHFMISCIIVREDSKDDKNPRFRQEHPIALWICTVMCGLSGVFVANFLFGNPLLDIFKETKLILFLTFIWYLMNFSPFDIVYKIAMFPPVALSAHVLQECLRLRFIYLGIQQAAGVYPGAPIIILLGGAIKGNGYGYIRIVERLVRGKWNPEKNDLLEVTYFAKSGLYASLVFLLHHYKIVTAPIEYLYLGVLVVFICGRLLVVVGGIPNPLIHIEYPIWWVLFDGTFKKSEILPEKEKQPIKDSGAKGKVSNVKPKSKQEKKKD